MKLSREACIGGFILFAVVLILIHNIYIYRKSLKNDKKRIGSLCMKDKLGCHNIPQIWLINLDDRTERLESALSNLEKSGIDRKNVTRFSAVDTRNMSIEEILKEFNASPRSVEAVRRGYRVLHREMTKGAIGCYMSHYRIWEKIAADDTKPFQFILEDDIHFRVKTQKFFENKTLPAIQNAFENEGYDIILLGWTVFGELDTSMKDKVWKYYEVGNRKKRNLDEKEYDDIQDINPTQLLLNSTTIYPLNTNNRFFCLHAYFLSNSGAKKLLESGKFMPMKYQIDSILSDMSQMGELKIGVVFPKFFHQAAHASDIQNSLPYHGSDNLQST